MVSKNRDGGIVTLGIDNLLSAEKSLNQGLRLHIMPQGLKVPQKIEVNLLSRRNQSTTVLDGHWRRRAHGVIGHCLMKPFILPQERMHPHPLHAYSVLGPLLQYPLDQV